jgi:hypothetical protein
MRSETDVLGESLLSVIRSGTALSDDEFGQLAIAVFRHQFAGNSPYRAYCERRGATPDVVRSWLEIPAVPTDAYKAAALVCGDAADAEAVFETSGTTRGAERRGLHYVADLRYYDAALREGFRSHLLPDGARPRMISLIAPAGDAPRSSLSHMTSAVTQEFGADASASVMTADGLDLETLRELLRAAERESRSVCLLTTSFALVHLFDAMEQRDEQFRLPAGSRIMDTGGFKGRSRELSRAELYRLAGERLGIGTEWCVNEYGMTEMSSQFYDGRAGQAAADVEQRLHAGPAWVRTRAVDPETLAILPDGETGILRHWDLANLNSVVALQTADLGVVRKEGFRLLGRAPGAEPRGCSLAVEDLLEAMRDRQL